MTPTSFNLMAEAIRGTVRVGVATLERLETIARLPEIVDIEAMWDQKARAAEAAELLTELAFHERLVRGLAKFGFLDDFPTFSADVSRLTPGGIVLVRAGLVDLHPTEGQVRLTAAAGRLSTRGWVDRDDILGIEKGRILRLER
jgi:hypothetical protein